METKCKLTIFKFITVITIIEKYQQALIMVVEFLDPQNVPILGVL